MNDEFLQKSLKTIDEMPSDEFEKSLKECGVLDNVDAWENRELGADERYVQVASDEEMEKFKQALSSPVKNVVSPDSEEK